MHELPSWTYAHKIGQYLIFPQQIPRNLSMFDKPLPTVFSSPSVNKMHILLYGLKTADVNECTRGMDSCHSHATCHNTPGSYTCTCNTGFTGNGISCTGKCSWLLNVLWTDSGVSVYQISSKFRRLVTVNTIFHHHSSTTEVTDKVIISCPIICCVRDSADFVCSAQ